VTARRTIHLLVTSAGNEFMVDLAQAFAAGLNGTSIDARVVVDRVPAGRDIPEIVVAPHEYFPLFLGARLSGDRLQEAIRNVFVLNVEQPGSIWFDAAFAFAASSRGILDISAEGAAEFRRRGYDAVAVPPGIGGRVADSVPSTNERRIDVTFLGHVSPRRERFFAAYADVFSRLNCRLIMVDLAKPRTDRTPGYQSSAARAALLRDSRILLNVHSSERTYFERHRALLALEYGAVLVSETSGDTAPLVDGQHFIAAPLDQLASACADLLANPAQLEAVRRAGLELARSDRTMDETTARLEEALERRLAAPRRRDFIRERRTSVRERLTHALARRAHGRRDWKVEAGPSATASPHISVVVTVYNYGRFLEECLRSVFTADPVPGGIEIVVVDDGSTDDSLTNARTLLKQAPVPMRLIAKETNTGLADARNVGLGVAEGEFVLTLDADNWIYPACLARLAEALTDPSRAAAYPTIRRYHGPSGEPLGLMSVAAWNVRDLVRRPYIDALAMFRRVDVLSVGGYSTELIDHGWFGWEDYDLWLKLAAEGHGCVHVPNVLASYRVHDASMLALTNEDPVGLVRYFRSKFRNLCAAHPDLDMYFGLPSDTRAVPAFDRGIDSGPSLQLRCLDLEREVLALRTSFSWRITAPVRALYRLMTGRP
jgi:glycosyltransferase involved in cell wall biosynthesis